MKPRNDMDCAVMMSIGCTSVVVLVNPPSYGDCQSIGGHKLFRKQSWSAEIQAANSGID